MTEDNQYLGGTDRRNTKPDLIGYAVAPRGDGAKSAWSRIGAAWAHRDGRGFDVRMDALPVSGRLTLRVPSPQGDDEETLDAPTADQMPMLE